MTCATATFHDVIRYDGRGEMRGVPRRHFSRAIVIGIACVAVVGASVACVTMTAAWIVGVALSGNPHGRGTALIGPQTIALTGSYHRLVLTTDVTGSIPVAAARAEPEDGSFDAQWARAVALVSASSVAAPLLPKRLLAAADVRDLTHVAALAPAVALVATLPAIVPLPPKRVAEQAQKVPLPRPSPVPALSVMAKPAVAPPQQIAMAPPLPPPSPMVRQAAIAPPPDNHAPSPFDPDGHTAIYDIEAHTVYLPNGERLEAHSGLGEGLDNPRYVDVRMHGPTPPNLYDLTLREELFHDVRAIRLNPVDEDKMHGRAGILAHSYMLGASGASFGCVSFKDYPEFLRAYLNGEVDRLRVVAHLDRAPVSVARARTPRETRFAFNSR